VSRGVRLFNGKNEQQITVLLPNPFLDRETDKILRKPDWSRLYLWDQLWVMEVSVLRGKTEEGERFADHVIAERGVRHGRLVMVPVDVEEEKHAHGVTPEHRHLHVHVRDAG